MIITITIRDTDDGQIAVSETRELDAGESDDTITPATSLADAMFNVMDHLAEVESLDEEGEPTQVGYLSEADIGLKVIIPLENKVR